MTTQQPACLRSTRLIVPLSTISQNGGVLPPSATSSQNAPRHGRSRGASIAKKSARDRGFSLVDERDAAVSKAIALALRRSQRVSEGSDGEGSGKDAKLDADEDGWVDLDDLVSPAAPALLKPSIHPSHR